MKKKKILFLLIVIVCFTLFINVSADVTVKSVCDAVAPELKKLVSIFVNLIKIGVPIILIILGMLDMAKAMASKDEGKIKDGQKTLITRCIYGAIVFFIVVIVQLLLNIISNATGDNVWSCVCEFVGGCKSVNVKDSRVYPTNPSANA